MARKVIETFVCDACKKKGLDDVLAPVELKIDGDEYNLCPEHGSKYRTLLREALGPVENVALSA